jgi:hypothetical protein
MEPEYHSGSTVIWLFGPLVYWLGVSLRSLGAPGTVSSSRVCLRRVWLGQFQPVHALGDCGGVVRIGYPLTAEFGSLAGLFGVGYDLLQ